MFNALGNYLCGRNLFSGLLDQFTGASAAYSLQRLSSSITNVVGARRSLDNAEKDFAASGVSGVGLRNWTLGDDSDLISFADGTNPRMYFDGVDDNISGSAIQATGRLSMTIIMTDIQAQYACCGGGRATPNADEVFFDFRDIGGLKLQSRVNNTGVESSALSVGVPYLVEMTWGAGTQELFIDGASQGTTAYAGSVSAQPLGFGVSPFASYFKGLIYDVAVYSDKAGTTLIHSYNGYGVDASDWEDQTGSSDGTVNGSPALFTGQGFDAYVPTLYDQSGSLGEPLSTFANRATAADRRMYFDGVDDYVALSDTAEIGIAASFSLTCTILTSGDITTEQIIISSGNSATDSFVISIKDGVLRTSFYDGSYQYAKSYTVDTNTIYGITYSYDGAGVAVLTVNGNASDGTLSPITLGLAAGFAIGSRHNGAPSKPYNGLIYDVAAYSDAAFTTPFFQVNGYGNTDADWEDQVGSNDGTVNGSPSLYEGRNATQSTAASQPQIVADGVVTTDSNGKIALLYNGSSHHMDSPLFASNQPNTIVSVFESETSPNEGQVYDGSGASRHMMDSTGGSWRIFAGSSLIGGTRDGDPHVAFALYNTTSSSLHVDGSAVASGDAGSQNWNNTLRIGGELDYLSGSLSEIIFYPSDQSANRTDIEANIAARYGITLP